MIAADLYVHFPFCRRKCSYCALYSRTGTTEGERDDYARRIATEIAARFAAAPSARLDSVYFGGGSPALCALEPVFSALSDHLTAATEFTVELHPLDVTEELLSQLADGGVNRISMGVQSLDDATLGRMGRGYTLLAAAKAFELVRKRFDNAGVDIIVGYPDDLGFRRITELSSWGISHCSVYSLQNERGLENVPNDDFVLDELRKVGATLAEMGLGRYEISNYALHGRECRHNLAVWRGKDYVGIGEGACGREGLTRTRGLKGSEYATETVTPDFDRKERTLFRLRTIEGLDATNFPEWGQSLKTFEKDGLLTEILQNVYRLTPRGTEVCDSILAELV